MDALSLAQACLAAIAKDAGQAGVTYCVEPPAGAETPLITTVEKGAAMVEAIGSPAVRTMIDICAAAQNEAAPIPDVIERWLPSRHIAHVHLNDPNRRTPARGTCGSEIRAELEQIGRAHV